MSQFFPRLLRALAFTAAAALVIAVVACPWLDASAAASDGWARAIHLFAQDTILRRTSLVSALGLWVTAQVFFSTKRPEATSPAPHGGLDA